ncbi:aminopeptidase P family protein [Butyrivibrio sp. NC3005]|uniref:aminopeptidase P family protein n=1 Tax=Butyrivibrio sp. NC3005 TaxID=1280685 RepID=UPI00041EF9C1|nr:aminopeptidase P family protein [Butyrivibrio sp. NC3005]
MENRTIMKRLKKLRAKMKDHGIDYYMMPTSDFHNSEYAADFFKAREYFTGFTGSNGTVVVSENWAGMWTDGRYFIQAEKEMEGTGVTLYKMMNENVPTIKEYLSSNMKKGQVLGFDGRVINTELGNDLEKLLSKKGASISYNRDIADEVWEDRPSLPCHDMYIITDELCGKSFKEKLKDVRLKMKENNCTSYLLCKLDDIMWLTNLRGDDVECNPVALSYAFITDEEFHLFVQMEEVTDDVFDYCSDNDMVLHDYFEVADFLKKTRLSGNIMYDKRNVNYSTYRSLLACAKRSNVELENVEDPTEIMKAVKNETELKNIRDIYLKDSAKLCEFIYWLKNSIGKEEITEYSAAMKLDSMRKEIPGFIELSFPTISAYGSNAAMMHYEATKDDFAVLKNEGMLLVDSGATYMGGTTDVTRTIVLGEISDEVKMHYTATCVGMLQLANCNFLKGCYGRNLDIMARGPIWAMDRDYKCGTGHGIGYMLNVHEGPQNIRWASRPGLSDAVLQAGMIVSDEPGVYVEGKHGIRIENILEVVEGVKNDDGQFLHFNQLTFAPIDLEAIDTKYMQPKDIEALNNYHKMVFEKVSPLIDDEKIVEWLKEATREVE